jgi:hypothetical protein
VGVARPLTGAALAGLLIALSGCSAIIAAAGRPDDLSVVRDGASREEVEDELGRPSRERAHGNGIEATYKVRVGPGGSPSANAGAVARAGLDTFESVTADVHIRDAKVVTGAVGAVFAVPAMLGTDVVLSVRELVRIARRKRKLVVSYDADHRVTGHHLVR